jgi:hypothetical protein
MTRTFILPRRDGSAGRRDLSRVCGSTGRCARPGLAARGHAALGCGVAAEVIAVLAAGVTRRLRTNAAPEPISDRPARANAQIAAM